MGGGQRLEVEEVEVEVEAVVVAEVVAVVVVVERVDLLVASLVKDLSVGLGCSNDLSHTYSIGEIRAYNKMYRNKLITEWLSL